MVARSAPSTAAAGGGRLRWAPASQVRRLFTITLDHFKQWQPKIFNTDQLIGRWVRSVGFPIWVRSVKFLDLPVSPIWVRSARFLDLGSLCQTERQIAALSKKLN